MPAHPLLQRFPRRWNLELSLTSRKIIATRVAGLREPTQLLSDASESLTISNLAPYHPSMHIHYSLFWPISVLFVYSPGGTWVWTLGLGWASAAWISEFWVPETGIKLALLGQGNLDGKEMCQKDNKNASSFFPVTQDVPNMVVAYGRPIL